MISHVPGGSLPPAPNTDDHHDHTSPSLGSALDEAVALYAELADLASRHGTRHLAKLATDAGQLCEHIHDVAEHMADVAGVRP
jgi:hypothetical protein